MTATERKIEGVVLVTGGCGFIGSSFVRLLLEGYPDARVVNLDALTYAGNLENLTAIEGAKEYRFVHGDITKPADVQRAFDEAAALGESKAAGLRLDELYITDIQPQEKDC